MPRRPSIVSLLCAVGLGLSLAPVTLARPAPDASTPPEPALKGPEVRDRKVPGVEGKFGEGGNEKKKLQSEQRIPPRVYKDALGTLKAESAPADVRLSPEQETKLKTIMDDFESSSRAFMQANRDKLSELRGSRGGDQANNNSGARAAYRDLMQQAPKVEDAWTKVWTELSPAQQSAVNTRLDQFRSRSSQMRQDEYVQKRLNRKLDKPGNGGPGEGRPGPEGKRPDGPGPRGPDGRDGREGRGPNGPGMGGLGMGRIDPQRRDRLMQLLSRMSPEQQDELIRRLEDRVGRGPDQREPSENPENRPPRRRSGRGGEDRPAPAMPPMPPMPPVPASGSDDDRMDDPMSSPPPAPGE